jgi:peroxiredoxin/predicted 2-oxoglutarate/Fe(II)-dependent dioxygenase YbiX
MNGGFGQLSVGEAAPNFTLPAHTGKPLGLTDVVGRPLVLFFYPKDDTPGFTTEACGFRDLLADFRKLGVEVMGISTDATESQAALASQHGLAFPLLSDPDGRVSTAYGVTRAGAGTDGIAATLARTTFLIDPNLRITKIYPDVPPGPHAAEVWADVKQLQFREEPRLIWRQAPVLLIPDVVDPALCRHLMHIWETEGNEDSGSMKQIGGQTVAVYDYDHKIRRDHYLQPGETKARLNRLIGRRVRPEIRKAFHFDVTRFEDLRIACYDANRGGYFRPHRDNTTDGTAHRCFAMSLNLNVGEYEGGYLRFPEYGPHLYRPETGSAVVFSCSLLHEATDISAGRRFVLLSFFYGEHEARLREEYNRRVAGDSKA